MQKRKNTVSFTGPLRLSTSVIYFAQSSNKTSNTNRIHKGYIIGYNAMYKITAIKRATIYVHGTRKTKNFCSGWNVEGDRLLSSEFDFYPRDAMLARVFAIATCLDVSLSVCPSHAGIVPSRAKAGS